MEYSSSFSNNIGGCIIMLITALLSFSFTYTPSALSSSEMKATVQTSPLISRVWHGWTSKENADQFEALLKKEIFPTIAKDKPKGYRGIQLLKREIENEVEFTTIMWFDSIESVKRFAGEDYEKAHIDPKVKSLLSRYDAQSTHLHVQYSSYE